MAIGTNAEVDFFGTETAVTTTGASTGIDALNPAGQWTNTDDAPFAAAVLTAAWATATSIQGKVVRLYGKAHNIRGTQDASDPLAAHPIIYLGAFMAPASGNGVTYYMPLIAGRMFLPNMYSQQIWEFFIENKTGQTISANWSLHVTPIARGPRA